MRIFATYVLYQFLIAMCLFLDTCFSFSIFSGCENPKDSCRRHRDKAEKWALYSNAKVTNTRNLLITLTKIPETTMEKHERFIWALDFGSFQLKVSLPHIGELGYHRCRSVVEENMLSTWWEGNREMKRQETRYTPQNRVPSDLFLPTGPCLSKFQNSTTTTWGLSPSASERHFLYKSNENQIGKINL